MKKKRLKLNELKVKSFMPQNEKQVTNTIKGGGRPTQIGCPTPGTWCYICPDDNTFIDQILA